MEIPTRWVSGALFLLGLATMLIAVVHVVRHDIAANGCETTYIYESYEPIALPTNISERFPRYSLYRYVSRHPLQQKGEREEERKGKERKGGEVNKEMPTSVAGGEAKEKKKRWENNKRAQQERE